MTYVSCLAAAKALLKNALPGFTTVDLLENVPSPYTRSQYPMVLLAHGDAREKRMGMPVASSNSGGRKLRWWPLTAYLWDYETGPSWDESTFLGYVETVENTFRLNNRLSNSGLSVNPDTATSFVLTAAEDAPTGVGITSKTKSIRDGRVSVTRYAEITCLVQEGIYG